MINERLYRSTANKDFIEAVLRAILGEFSNAYLEVTKIKGTRKQAMPKEDRKQ